MARPDPRERADSRTVATLRRSPFLGWWAVMNNLRMTTKQARALATQGIPGACAGTLKHTITGLAWRVLTEDGQENEETAYYTLLLDHARDATGAVIGFDHFLELGAGDLLCANEGWTYEIVRVDKGPYAGVPVNLYCVDAATLRPGPSAEQPVRQVVDGREDVTITLNADEVGRAKWESYNEGGMEFYNLHPIYKAYVALAMLTAEDNYTYELMTQVIPQGLLNLGEGFSAEQAREWKAAWDAAKTGNGKLDDIGLLYGTTGAAFIQFGAPPREMPFQHASYWYLTLVTACFEMSPFDLGYMTQINTKAGSEMTVELSRNKGLRHLLTRLKRSIEHNVLPEGLVLAFPDLDPSDEIAESDVRLKNTMALSRALQGGFLSVEEAREEAVRLGAYEIDPNAPAPGPVEATQSEEPPKEGAKVGKSATVAASVRLIPNGADDPIPPPPSEADLDDGDAEQAEKVWDAVMKDWRGILSAEPRNRESYDDAE